MLLGQLFFLSVLDLFALAGSPPGLSVAFFAHILSDFLNFADATHHPVSLFLCYCHYSASPLWCPLRRTELPVRTPHHSFSLPDPWLEKFSPLACLELGKFCQLDCSALAPRP